MQSATVSLVLLTSVIVSGYHSSGVKLRRDGVLNLYPFPRVGRSSAPSWQHPSLHTYSAGADFEQTNKRQLYAFPRVGRSRLSFGGAGEGPNGAEGARDDGSMWFGPRLGRAVNSVEDAMFQSFDGSDPEQLEPENNPNRLKRTADQM